MNRQEFIQSLRDELAKLPPEEIVDATQYFEECFDEATDGLEGGAKLAEEERLAAEFGSPKRIAAQIKSDYAAKILDGDGHAGGEKPGAKKKLSAVWWILIGICSAPIAIPGVIFTFTMVICVLIGIIAAFISGIALTVMGIAGLVQSVSGGVMTMGIGLMLLAVSAAAGFGAFIAMREIIRLIARNVRENNRKRKADESAADVVSEGPVTDTGAEEIELEVE